MTDLMDILYSFAQDHEIEALLVKDDKYQESVRCTRGQEDGLRAVLDETAANILDDFLEEQRLLQFVQEEVCFWAGFRMALELTR